MTGETAGQPDEGLAVPVPGSVVAGRYRLHQTIGAGAIGTVFPARDELLDRDVALKVIASPSGGDRQSRSRFAREVEAAARVSHPSVIPVIDFFDGPDDTMVVVMPLVRGRNLSEMLFRVQWLPAGRIADIISAVASALDAVHRAGLVHRDVKPANILVELGGELPDRVYLVDFGISEAADALSEHGRFVGTPAYAAPEQIQGNPVDGRADQYSLAVVAFTLLTGEMPFRGDEALHMLYAHLYEPPPRAASLQPSLPVEIDAVLARALAKRPDERFGSTGEFAEALRTALMTNRLSTDSQLASPGDAEPALSDEVLSVAGHQRGSTGQRPDDHDNVLVNDQRTWDEALADFPPTGSAEQSRHRGATMPAGSGQDTVSPPGVPDPPGPIGRPYWRSPIQAFIDGLGRVFDIFGVIQRQRWSPPAFEDTLAEDARALCLELGLILRGGNDSKEGTS